MASLPEARAKSLTSISARENVTIDMPIRGARRGDYLAWCLDRLDAGRMPARQIVEIARSKLDGAELAVVIETATLLAEGESDA